MKAHERSLQSLTIHNHRYFSQPKFFSVLKSIHGSSSDGKEFKS